ncbi:uncharacterized protein BJX67DRAFT_262189 [Aspergillus lucknowensis]|uniref:Uncharacterized protein n=1 Tax=Aspergillus lucknowensis TaxID=176173 RepID=A0ABR4LFW0_9EURO
MRLLAFKFAAAWQKKLGLLHRRTSTCGLWCAQPQSGCLSIRPSRSAGWGFQAAPTYEALVVNAPNQQANEGQETMLLWTLMESSSGEPSSYEVITRASSDLQAIETIF